MSHPSHKELKTLLPHGQPQTVAFGSSNEFNFRTNDNFYCDEIRQTAKSIPDEWSKRFKMLENNDRPISIREKS